MFTWLLTATSILTYLIPDAKPITFYQYTTAIPHGLYKSLNIIIFVLALGGVYKILDKSGVINAVIGVIWEKFNTSVNTLIALLMLFISLLCAFTGILTELIALIPIMIVLTDKLKLPKIIGLSIVLISAKLGFAAGITNPYTVQIPQELAGLPINSGFLFRTVFFFISFVIIIQHLFNYIKKHRDAYLSCAHENTSESENFKFEKFTFHHKWIAFVFVITFVLMIILPQFYHIGRNINLIGYLFIGIMTAFISKMSFKESVFQFFSGVQYVFLAALIIGFARAIEVVLHESTVIDIFIAKSIHLIQNFFTFASILTMFVMQGLLDVFVPSATGQAMLSIPILLPVAQVANIHPQVVTLAFQFGDGFTNLITPTSGVLLAFLSYGQINYRQWFKFIFPLFIKLVLLSIIFLYITKFELF